MKFDFLQKNQYGGEWDRVRVPHGWLVFYYENRGLMQAGQAKYPAVAAITL